MKHRDQYIDGRETEMRQDKLNDTIETILVWLVIILIIIEFIVH